MAKIDVDTQMAKIAVDIEFWSWHNYDGNTKEMAVNLLKVNMMLCLLKILKI